MNARLPVASGCACCTSRRRFLAASCGLCAAAALPPLVTRLAAAEASSAAARPRVRLVFACFTVKQERPTWPHIGYDFAADIERVTAALRQQCPGVEFLPVLAHGPEDAEKLLAADDADRIDGYLVYQMNNWVKVMQTIVASGKPTLVADFLYAGSGGFLVYTAGLRRAHQNFSVVGSSQIEDLAASAKCFEVLKKGGSTGEFVAACDRVRRERTPAADPAPCKDDPLQVADVGQCLAAMKRAKLVTVGGKMQNVAKEIEQQLGIGVVLVEFPEMKEAYEKTDLDKARDCRTLEGRRSQRHPGRHGCHAGEVGAKLPGSASGDGQTRGRSDHDQLPGRLLRWALDGLSVPGIRRTAERGSRGSV